MQSRGSVGVSEREKVPLRRRGGSVCVCVCVYVCQFPPCAHILFLLQMINDLNTSYETFLELRTNISEGETVCLWTWGGVGVCGHMLLFLHVLFCSFIKTCQQCLENLLPSAMISAHLGNLSENS